MTLASTSVLTFDLGFDLDLYFALTLNLCLNLDINLNLDHDLGFNLDSTLDLCLGLNLDLGLGLNLGRMGGGGNNFRKKYRALQIKNRVQYREPSTRQKSKHFITEEKIEWKTVENKVQNSVQKSGKMDAG